MWFLGYYLEFKWFKKIALGGVSLQGLFIFLEGGLYLLWQIY